MFLSFCSQLPFPIFRLEKLTSSIKVSSSKIVTLGFIFISKLFRANLTVDRIRPLHFYLPEAQSETVSRHKAEELLNSDDIISTKN